MTKSYSGLERDNSKPRRGSFLNYFWTSSIHAVCFCNCYFNFNLRNPRKAYTVSAPQEEKQSKNLTSCGPAFADLDLEKQHGKVIQQTAGGKNKLLEKGMKTPWSSLVIDLLTSISNCHYCGKIHKKAVSQVPDNRNYQVFSHVHPNLDLSKWSIDISTNLSYFFCLLLATGLVGFKWNLLHNLFHFDNGMQYMHVL